MVAPLLGGLALMAGFVAHERRATSPLLRLGILRVRSLRAASLGAGVNSVAFTAIVYVGTLYLQLALGYGPLQAGLALLPLDAVAFVVPVAGARAIARRAPRSLLLASFTLTALALLWLARAPVPADYIRDVLGPLIVLGRPSPSDSWCSPKKQSPTSTPTNADSPRASSKPPTTSSEAPSASPSTPR